MSFFFVDPGALARRYIAETGSEWLRSLLNPTTGSNVIIVRTTAVDMFAAISRREREGTLTRTDAKMAKLDIRSDLDNEYQIVEMTGTVVNFAMQLTELYGLRAHAAIQLAAVMQVNILLSTLRRPHITLISSDAELNAAANAQAIAVEDPNDHR